MVKYIMINGFKQKIKFPTTKQILLNVTISTLNDSNSLKKVCKFYQTIQAYVHLDIFFGL